MLGCIQQDMDRLALEAAQQTADLRAPVAYPEEMYVARDSQDFKDLIASQTADPTTARFYCTGEQWKFDREKNGGPIQAPSSVLELAKISSSNSRADMQV